jgi:hypothetical protein
MTVERPPINVADLLAWADTSAAMKDYVRALRWLEQAERITGTRLPPAYRARREQWRRAAVVRERDRAGATRSSVP